MNDLPQDLMRAMRASDRCWAIVAVLLLSVPVFAGQGIDSFAEPNIKVDLAANEPGVLDALNCREGDSVKVGDLVAALDFEVLQAQLAVFEARAESSGSADSAQAELDLRRLRLEALRELDARGHANPSELHRAEADYRIAQAGLQTVIDEQNIMRLEAARIRQQIRRRQIYSPIDGVIVKTHKEQGESVPMNSPEVVTIAQLNPLRIHFPVPIAAAHDLRNGAEVSIEFPEYRISRAARIELVSPVMDPKSSTVNVTVLIENENHELMAGTRCKLALAGSSIEPPQPTQPQPDLTSRDHGDRVPLRNTSTKNNSKYRWPFSGK